ncbi:sec-independent protein translocase protein TatA [Streptomyces sp. Amel2xB2]|uniref:Sec-independent protein translocase subunit TatA n=1 Tax=Streptomyces sp. Amel2xB2 TaxID=1305829 RepID=UPI000DB99DFA|nr:Sec-independent protein translocase subunit TatA [Streptomyces sp. Amel2xB2]RAJ66861.1 sec-independent protein translocase protein TatA [Streptomyces sp. Amel2xB2]
MFGISEAAVLIIVAVLVFGAKKLPELARSAGKSLRILKSEAKALKSEGRAEGADSPSAARYSVRPAPGERPGARSDQDPGGAPRGS